MLRETSSWSSPESSATYPAGWEVEIVPEALSLTITPTVAGQEIVAQATPIYWEGSVAVDGTRAGRSTASGTWS